MSFIIRLLVNAAALWIADLLIGDIRFDPGSFPINLLIVALIFGLVNALVKPILTILTLPLTIITLGIFLLVLNALMLMFTSGISDILRLGFHVEGFLAALLGSIVISLVSFVLSRLLPDAR